MRTPLIFMALLWASVAFPYGGSEIGNGKVVPPVEDSAQKAPMPGAPSDEKRAGRAPLLFERFESEAQILEAGEIWKVRAWIPSAATASAPVRCRAVFGADELKESRLVFDACSLTPTESGHVIEISYEFPTLTVPRAYELGFVELDSAEGMATFAIPREPLTVHVVSEGDPLPFEAWGARLERLGPRSAALTILLRSVAPVTAATLDFWVAQTRWSYASMAVNPGQMQSNWIAKVAEEPAGQLRIELRIPDEYALARRLELGRMVLLNEALQETSIVFSREGFDVEGPIRNP